MSFVRVAILKHGLTIWDKALVPPSEVERRKRAIRLLMEQNGWEALIAYSDHHAIYEAIAVRDPHRARLAVRRVLERSLRRLEKE